MESDMQELLQSCRRPRHFRLDQWYDDSAGVHLESRISYKPSGRESEALKKQKAKKRLERWWHKGPDNSYQTAPSSEKFAEAKRQRFTAEGRGERVSRSLAALSETPRIHLTPDEWRQIVEDPDLEDQSS